MANRSQLDFLRRGVEAWTSWREENFSVKPDLRKANLTGADLTDAFLHDANLTDAYLARADLSGAHLARANLFRADLTDADLTDATLFRADLTEAILTEANVTNAVLERSTLVETNLEATTLTGCGVYGASAWDVKLGGAEQKDLIVSPKGESIITVDDLEVAQFFYLLLNGEWAPLLGAAMTASRREDLNHGTNAAHVHECVCKEFREHQCSRVTTNRWASIQLNLDFNQLVWIAAILAHSSV